MMEVEKLDSLSAYQNASYYAKLVSKAVKEAKEINRKNGLPNDFVINGKLYFELSNGEITAENPLTKKEA
jgi:hypothetical protein